MAFDAFLLLFCLQTLVILGVAKKSFTFGRFADDTLILFEFERFEVCRVFFRKSADDFIFAMIFQIRQRSADEFRSKND